ncbi:MAG: alpha/beta fold hydrolase [Gammaproteobacteria bacterium]|nr:alpha/beta fold hydrolase [Gammaproteobacteria bacterium]
MQCTVLTTADKLQIHCYGFKTPGATQAFVISPGRMELAIKYAELCFELVQAGYSVYLIDHRGQGLSQRALLNPHKGYVSHFGQYQQDLALFIEQVVLPAGHSQHIALGHSMGCAILAGYMQQYPHPFNAAILCSPMFGIYTGLVPYRLAQSIALAYGALNQALSREPWYFPGQGNYKEKPFIANPLTGCAPRYQWLMQLYRDNPKAQLGGVTSSWVNAAIKAMAQLQRDAARWRIPVLLLQAAADKVVSNHAQNVWLQQLPADLIQRKVILANARHEIFIETDDIRQQAFIAINQFLQQLPSAN